MGGRCTGSLGWRRAPVLVPGPDSTALLSTVRLSTALLSRMGLGTVVRGSTRLGSTWPGSMGLDSTGLDSRVTMGLLGRLRVGRGGARRCRLRPMGIVRMVRVVPCRLELCRRQPFHLLRCRLRVLVVGRCRRMGALRGRRSRRVGRCRRTGMAGMGRVRRVASAGLCRPVLVPCRPVRPCRRVRLLGLCRPLVMAGRRRNPDTAIPAFRTVAPHRISAPRGLPPCRTRTVVPSRTSTVARCPSSTVVPCPSSTVALCPTSRVGRCPDRCHRRVPPMAVRGLRRLRRSPRTPMTAALRVTAGLRKHRSISARCPRSGTRRPRRGRPRSPRA